MRATVESSNRLLRDLGLSLSGLPLDLVQDVANLIGAMAAKLDGEHLATPRDAGHFAGGKDHLGLHHVVDVHGPADDLLAGVTFGE